MSIGEASARAATLLADGRVFECREAQGDEAALVMLPPELQRVFRRYHSIVPVIDPDVAISREAMGPSELRNGFIRVGWVAGGESGGELAVHPPEETIYLLYPDEPIDATFGTYGSVYHWIVAVASAAEPDANSE